MTFPTAPDFDPAPTMLSSSEMLAGIREFSEIAAKDGVDVALCGGAAMHAYGGDRLTSDIDFIASRGMPSLQVCSPLTFGGAACSTPSGIPVDVIVRDDEYADLYAEALAQARAIPGMPVKVVRAGYLVAMKLVAGREKDHLDLHYILTAAIDYKLARNIVKKHLGLYAAEELDGMREEARWMKGRAK